MKSSFYQNKTHRLPIFVSLPILLVVFVTLIYVGKNFSNMTFQNSNSEKKIILTNVKIGNLLPESASIFFQTNDTVISSVAYKAKNETEFRRVSDERVTSGKPKEFKNHLYTLKNLKPDQIYEFRITIGGQEINSFAQEALEFKTPLRINVAKDQLPSYGKILSDVNLALPNSIAMLETKGNYPIFSTVKEDGSFLLSTCCLLDYVNLESPKIISDDEIVRIIFYTESQKETTIEKKFAETHEISDKLSYGADQLQNTNAQEPLDKELALQVTPQTSSEKIKLANTNLEIDYPISNKSIPGTRPLIAGSAKPNSKIRLQFTTEKKEFELTSSSDGKWSYSPNFDLTTGPQQIRVTAQIAKAPPQEKTVKFFIQKSGEAVLGAVLQASDEATISLTPAVIASSTPTPTFASQITLSPTLTPTPLPPESGVDTLIPSLLIIAGFAILSTTILLSF